MRFQAAGSSGLLDDPARALDAYSAACPVKSLLMHSDREGAATIIRPVTSAVV